VADFGAKGQTALTLEDRFNEEHDRLRETNRAALAQVYQYALRKALEPSQAADLAECLLGDDQDLVQPQDSPGWSG
jgi:hypothetical protein